MSKRANPLAVGIRFGRLIQSLQHAFFSVCSATDEASVGFNNEQTQELQDINDKLSRLIALAWKSANKKRKRSR